MASPGYVEASSPQPRLEPSAQTSTTIRLRLDLQQRARHNFRRHWLRAATRATVLVFADLLSFWVMRALVRAVRDQGLLGQSFAAQVQDVLPRGILNGWQFAAALLLSLLVIGCYGAGDHRRDPRRVFMAAALATALPLWMTIWTRGLPEVLVQYALTTVLVWAGLMSERLVVDRIVAWVRPPAKHAARTLFLGQEDACRDVMVNGAFAVGTDFNSLGFVDTRMPPSPHAVGQINDLSHMLRDLDIETLVVCGYLSDHRFYDVVDLALAAGCQVLTVPRALQFTGVQPSVVWRRSRPFIELTAPSLRGPELVVKRILDLIGALVGMVVLSPIFAACAIAVRGDSQGPVFFSQERVGRGGRPFRIWKFRTMVPDAERRRSDLADKSVYRDGRLFKIPDDPRITRVGRWLRRTSLDELPQLFNVVLGDMSLVGPRPPLPAEVALYEAHHYARFDVKPGVTGPWQVAGRNEIRDFESVIRLERDYIRDWSLAKDLAILVRTIPAVFKMNGAH